MSTILILALLGTTLEATDSSKHTKTEDNYENTLVQSSKLLKTAIVVSVVLGVAVIGAGLIGSFVYRWRRAQRLRIPIKDQDEESELQESSPEGNPSELLPPE